jgi:hypothetical protein
MVAMVLVLRTSLLKVPEGFSSLVQVVSVSTLHTSFLTEQIMVLIHMLFRRINLLQKQHKKAAQQ